ncbi:hypothetical protein PISMIDRAFT_412400 [Pisolithus microcarpus 441]|uniref:Uncharacterized protein n=1 Tax=Pisolithus microcarpus 441 TaxID=765257 RepID=A0A0C9ZEJ8_9AGAM|nr:hypothetical protein BKA83DRAFT_412400 [Pisolithus microcarpus]KIK24339.1 hypothetical protein PISMIDRAFT_412400 [Pisolithus microcarpus 441]
MHQGILQLALKARRKCHRPTQIHLYYPALSSPINLHPLLPAVGSPVFLAPALNDSWKTPRAKTETRSNPRFGAVAVYYSLSKSWNLKYKQATTKERQRRTIGACEQHSLCLSLSYDGRLFRDVHEDQCMSWKSRLASCTKSSAMSYSSNHRLMWMDVPAVH